MSHGATEGFMEAWRKHETAPRTRCPECHFESSEGYPPSHAPGCVKGTRVRPDGECRSCGDPVPEGVRHCGWCTREARLSEVEPEE